MPPKTQENKTTRKRKPSKPAGSKEQPAPRTSKIGKASASKSPDDRTVDASRAARSAKDRSMVSTGKGRAESKLATGTDFSKKSRSQRLPAKKKSGAPIAQKPSGEATDGAGADTQRVTKASVYSKAKRPSSTGKDVGANQNVRSEGADSKRDANVTASAKDGKTKDADTGAPPDTGTKKSGKKRRAHVRRKSMVIATMAKMIGRKRNRPGKCSDSDSEESMSSKEQLSLFVVAVLGAFFFCFVLVLLSYYYFAGTNIPVAVACVSKECLEARAYLDGILNDAKDPCADFYGHVCDSWSKKGSSFHGDVYRASIISFNTSLFRSLKVKHEDDLRHGIHVVRPVYRSCYRYMSVPVELKDAMKETHELLEVAELLKAPSFFDVVRYLVRQSMQIGISSLFSCIFVYENGRNMLFMSHGYSLHQKLGATFHSGVGRHYLEIALKAWLGLNDVTKELRTLVEEDAKVHGLLKGRAPAEQQVSLREFIADMVPNVTAEQWVQAVKSSQREPVVLEVTDEILVKGGGMFKPAFQALAASGLQKSCFYLATSLVAAVASMLSRRDEIAKSELSKARYCLSFTHKCLTLTWAFLASRYASTPQSVSVLSAMLASIQGVFTENPDIFTWMEQMTRTKTADVLYRTSLRVIAGDGFNVSRIDYRKEEVTLNEEDSFLKVLLLAFRLQYTVMSTSPPTRLEMFVSDLEFGSTIAYIPEKQYIVLPTLYQRKPYTYTFGVPDYYNYGTMGVLISQRLAEAAGVGTVASRQEAWDRTTKSQYADTIACLVDRRKRMGFAKSDEVTAGQQTQLLALSISVRYAYLGLVKMFRIRSGTGRVFNEYWPEAQRVFFARYCLLWCSGNEVGDPLTPREKCLLPLHNMPEFAELYKCDVNATTSGGPVCKV